MVTTSPVLYPARDVPNHCLRTLMVFVFPTPIPSIFIISLPTLIKSPPKNEVIPANSIISLVVNTSFSRWVVTAVDTRGDWIMLSSVTSTFEFWFIETNLWDVPIPTLVKSTLLTTPIRASFAVAASLILSSVILTANTDDGNLSVVPTPTNPSVDAIPSAWVVPAPAWMYWSSSPVTK